MGKGFGGETNETGFRIYDKSGIEARTKGYKEPAEIKKWKWILMSSSVIFIAGTWVGIFYVLGMMDLGLPLIGSIVLSGLLAMGALAFLAAFFVSPFLEKRWKKNLIRFREEHPEEWRARAEYHACEHKLVHLLEKNREVNLENLQDAPPFSPWCGGEEHQVLMLAEPSLEKLMETMEVGQEYLRRKTKQSP